MDTDLAIASKRDQRSYRPDPLGTADLESILQAGRMAGSGKNRQARRFVVLRDCLDRAASLVTRPTNLEGAPVAVAVVGIGNSSYLGFDAGRAAQNMMLAAWDLGIVSCPNAIADRPGMANLLGLSPEEEVVIILSFGFPKNPRRIDQKTVDQWIGAADRLPLDELVEYR